MLVLGFLFQNRIWQDRLAQFRDRDNSSQDGLGWLTFIKYGMPIFSEGHFGIPGQILGLSVGACFLEDEDYCSSFSILLGREELA